MRWWFRRNRDEHDELVTRLKSERPRADEDFVDRLAGRVRDHGRFRGIPVRVALAATSAALVLGAVAMVGGAAQYTTALGAAADLAKSTVVKPAKDDDDDDDDDDDSAEVEYAELRKQCKKEVSAAKKAEDKDGSKLTKDQKAEFSQLKHECSQIGK